MEPHNNIADFVLQAQQVDHACPKRKQSAGMRAALGMGALPDDAETRPSDDFWATPPEGTLALINSAWFKTLVPVGSRIWEPFCGNGAMSKVLEEAGFDVVSTNLTDRGYGKVGVNFRHEKSLRADVIVSNPPFSGDFGNAAEMVRHALALKPRLFFFLMKSTFLHAPTHRPDMCLYKRPNLKLDLGFRLDFTGQGSPSMETSWYCWIPALLGSFESTGCLVKPSNITNHNFDF